MKHMAWRAATGALATTTCMQYRHLTRRGTCPLCGITDEDSYHALVACNHARSIWEGMRRVWFLPHDHLFVNSGHEWLLNLLLNCNEAERDRVLMLIWRIWQLRNDLAHDK